jgi:hypothetical protein
MRIAQKTVDSLRREVVGIGTGKLNNRCRRVLEHTKI